MGPFLFIDATQKPCVIFSLFFFNTKQYLMKKTKNNDNDKKKNVTFGTVELRLYQMTLGDNPSVSIGPPVCIGDYYEVVYSDDDGMFIEEFETLRFGKRRQPQSNQMKFNYYQRYEILYDAGYEDKSIRQAERTVSKDQLKRNVSYYYCYPYVYTGKIKSQIGRQRNKRFLKKQPKTR